MMKLKNNFNMQSSLLVIPKMYNEDQIKQWLKSKLNLSDLLFYIIALKNNNQPLGYIQVKDMDTFHRNGEIGVCLDEEYQGKGYFSEAYSLLEKNLVKNYDLIKLNAKIRIDNQKSIKSFSKLGFKLTGVLHKQYKYKNRYYDIQIYEKFLNE